MASLIDVDLQPGRPPVVRAEADGAAANWPAGHRNALRAVVAEYGSVLVRGLGLHDAAETGAVFQRLAASLMPEQEAFAPRQPYPGGLYSATPWPPNQQMCMHHELSYKLEFPGLMLFACLAAPAGGGATTVSDSPTVLGALPADLVQRFAHGLDHLGDEVAEPGALVADPRVQVPPNRAACVPQSRLVPGNVEHYVEVYFPHSTDVVRV